MDCLSPFWLNLTKTALVLMTSFMRYFLLRCRVVPVVAVDKNKKKVIANNDCYHLKTCCCFLVSLCFLLQLLLCLKREGGVRGGGGGGGVNEVRLVHFWKDENSASVIMLSKRINKRS